VSSVFTRVGAVVAADADYDASKIVNVPSGGITQTRLQGVVNSLDGRKPEKVSPATPNAAVRFSGGAGVQKDSPLIIADDVSLSKFGGGGIDIEGFGTGFAATDAPVGYKGEYLSVQLLQASAIGLTNGVAADVTTLNIGIGDWLVWVTGVFRPVAATSITELIVGGNLAATIPTAGSPIRGFASYRTAAQVPGVGNIAMPTNCFRLLIGAASVIHLVMQAAFTASTMQAFGTISALRVR
jgi:hypothetical protein